MLFTRLQKHWVVPPRGLGGTGIKTQANERPKANTEFGAVVRSGLTVT